MSHRLNGDKVEFCREAGPRRKAPPVIVKGGGGLLISDDGNQLGTLALSDERIENRRPSHLPAAESRGETE